MRDNHGCGDSLTRGRTPGPPSLTPRSKQNPPQPREAPKRHPALLRLPLIFAPCALLLRVLGSFANLLIECMEHFCSRRLRINDSPRTQALCTYNCPAFVWTLFDPLYPSGLWWSPLKTISWIKCLWDLPQARGSFAVTPAA